MIEIEKCTHCLHFAKGQAAQNEMRSNGTVRESQKHAREKTLINALLVKPCFKSVFQNRDSRYSKIL